MSLTIHKKGQKAQRIVLKDGLQQISRKK